MVKCVKCGKSLLFDWVQNDDGKILCKTCVEQSIVKKGQSKPIEQLQLDEL